MLFIDKKFNDFKNLIDVYFNYGLMYNDILIIGLIFFKSELDDDLILYEDLRTKIFDYINTLVD